MITLDWVSDNHRKVSYAASFGHSVFWGNEELRAKMAHDMQKFDAFSVREEDAVALVNNTFGVDAEWVMDPVFLCDKKHYIDLAENATRKNENPHIFAYILDTNDVDNKILELCSKEKKLEVELFSEMLFKPTEKKLELEQDKFTFKLRQAKIEERLYSLIHSEFIVADSFHGICFAIIFEIPFVAILNKNRGATRFYTILKKMNLLDRLVTSVEEAQEVLKRDVDFTTSREVIKAEKERCINWLLNALVPENEVKKSYSFDDIVTQKFDVQNKRYRLSEMKINALMNGRLFNTVSDVSQYLEMLRQYMNELIVAIAVRDTPGFELNEKIDSLLHDIGCKTSLVDKHWQSYVFVMDGGNVISEVISNNQERVAYTGTIQGKSYKVVSRSYNKGDVAAIQIDGAEYSENRRGLNIVLVDKNLNEVIDTVVFDTHEKNVPCYRNGVLCRTHLPKFKAKQGEVVLDSAPKNVAAPIISKKEEKTQDNAVMSGINKDSELLMHNAMLLAAVGGSAFDYFIDKGISRVAIYGSDLLVSYLYEQAYYKDIEIVNLLSDEEKQLDIRFPRVGKITLEPLSKIDFDSFNIPVIIADVSYPISLLNYKTRGNEVWKVGELCHYSHYKRFLFDPLLKYKQNYANLKLAIFDSPSVHQIQNPSELELDIRKKYPNHDRLRVRKEVFEKNGFDGEYIQEVMAPIDVKKGKIDNLADKTGKYVNVVNGYRVTTDTPTDFTNTVYLFGNSICYGLGTEDKDTVASILQREINKEKNSIGKYAVLNCCNGGGLNAKQMMSYIKYHMPQNGDVVVIMMSTIGPLLKEMYDDRFVWCKGEDVLNRPHELGEIFIDSNHINAKGQAACGKYLAKMLYQNKVLLGDKCLKEINKDRGTPIFSTSLNEIENEELDEYINSLASVKRINVSGRIGSIVMNCNPFTLGHRYLIETAAKKCEVLYIFVVEENRSVFSFADRLELVRKGVKDLENVVVLPSGKFIISQTTFSAYFLKEEQKDAIIDPSEDVFIFASKIAPALDINIRFAGEEPFDKITNQYNASMKRILPKYGIEFEVIKRKEEGGEVISASKVRHLLQNKEFEKIKRIVPETTYDYLYEKYKDSKRVLVLGGTRFMGIRLVEQMIERNWFITLATRGIQKDSFGKNVIRVKLDRKNEQSIIDAIGGKNFDYIFDNIAYNGKDVERLLPHVKCKNYIQVSSVAVYRKHHSQLKEDELNTYHMEYLSSDVEKDYGIAKYTAECVALQQFPDVSTTIVRIPFVVEPDNLENKELNMRLFFYVEHIMQRRAIKVDNLDYLCTFVRTKEEADFLIYLAENNLSGIYNFSSNGSITVGEIIKYIEDESGIKAIYSNDGDIHPFNSAHFKGVGCTGYSYDLSKTINTGYQVSELKDWIYGLLDSYIKMFK